MKKSEENAFLQLMDYVDATNRGETFLIAPERIDGFFDIMTNTFYGLYRISKEDISMLLEDYNENL